MAIYNFTKASLQPSLLAGCWCLTLSSSVQWGTPWSVTWWLSECVRWFTLNIQLRAHRQWPLSCSSAPRGSLYGFQCQPGSLVPVHFHFHHRLCSLSLCFPTPRCPPLPSFCRYKSAINWVGLHSLHFIRVKASPGAFPRCFVSAKKRNYATIPRLWSWNVVRTASMQPLCDINMIIDLIWVNEFENITENISRQCFVVCCFVISIENISPSFPPFTYTLQRFSFFNPQVIMMTGMTTEEVLLCLYSAQSNYSSPPDTLLNKGRFTRLAVLFTILDN